MGITFWCLAPFLLRGFTWVKLCGWTQNQPKKVGTRIANLRPRIGQIPLLSLDIIGHNSIIFYPFLTCFILNCLLLGDESNGVQIKALSLLVNILVFGLIFFSEASHG